MLSVPHRVFLALLGEVGLAMPSSIKVWLWISTMDSNTPRSLTGLTRSNREVYSAYQETKMVSNARSTAISSIMPCNGRTRPADMALSGGKARSPVQIA